MCDMVLVKVLEIEYCYFLKGQILLVNFKITDRQNYLSVSAITNNSALIKYIYETATGELSLASSSLFLEIAAV